MFSIFVYFKNCKRSAGPPLKPKKAEGNTQRRERALKKLLLYHFNFCIISICIKIQKDVLTIIIEYDV